MKKVSLNDVLVSHKNMVQLYFPDSFLKVELTFSTMLQFS